MKNSKLCLRQQTEEEKAEAAAANVKGKAPPPKGKGKEEEPSKEEVERIENERKSKEERETKLKAEWDALSEHEQFTRTNEDIFKEPAIKMQNNLIVKQIEKLNAKIVELAGQTEEIAKLQAEIDELNKTALIGIMHCEKSGFELIEFEEFVKEDGGAWLLFSKLPVQEPAAAEEAKGGKKAPAKGKAAATEEIKPVYGKVWVDLGDLSSPGAKEIT